MVTGLVPLKYCNRISCTRRGYKQWERIYCFLLQVFKSLRGWVKWKS